MKKLFLVKRTDIIDWDEYKSCILIADSLDEVEKIINNNDMYWDYGKREINEVDLEREESQVLLASFKAG